MKRLSLNCVIIFLFCAFLSACSMKIPQSINLTATQKATPRKNLEYNAVLTDPVIKKDFRNLKAAAMKASLYKKDDHYYIAENDIKRLNTLSAILIDRLENHYHLDKNIHKIHTFIGKNQIGSCYEYYDSMPAAIGNDCHSYLHPLDNCQNCDELIKLLQKRVQRIVQLPSKNATILTDSFKLRNKDYVYLGLAIS